MDPNLQEILGLAEQVQNGSLSKEEFRDKVSLLIKSLDDDGVMMLCIALVFPDFGN